MKEVLTPAQIFRICASLAQKLQSLDVSWIAKIDDALKDQNLGTKILLLIEEVVNPPPPSVEVPEPAPQLEILRPLKDDETLVGRDFIKRSARMIREEKKEALGDAEYTFFGNPDNHHLLLREEALSVVFLGTEFQSEGSTHVRALCREEGSLVWSATSIKLDQTFDQSFGVAVSPSFSLVLSR